MKASNSIFLLLVCASVASSIYASAPAPINTSGRSSMPEGEAQIEGETGSEEIELVAADQIAKCFIQDKKDRLAKTYDANIKASRDTLMQKRAFYAKAIAKKHSSEELTWQNIGEGLVLEIRARLVLEDCRLKKEFDGHMMTEDYLNVLSGPVSTQLYEDFATCKEFIKEHPTITIREYLESDACKVQ